MALNEELKMPLRDKNDELYGISTNSKTDFDFIGFTFNGKHSSDLGIIRVSEGSRYSDDLLPIIEDNIVPVPGNDGVYYFGSYYRQKNFIIQIAFDNLTDKQFRELKMHFGKKQLGDLIFDESPYKAYKVKITGVPNLNYICFDEYVQGSDTLQRIYKGEGTITFSAFQPFARSVYKSLNEYNNENKQQWAMTSGMLETLDGYDVFEGNEAKIFNPGDLEADFQIKFSFSDGENDLEKIYLKLENEDASNYQITFKSPITKINGDVGFIFDTKTNLLQGYDSKGNLTGSLYNKYIENGYFYKIPILNDSTEDNKLCVVGDVIPTELTYNYSYF